MNNLLIPTDFTPYSVRLAAQAVKMLNKKTNIVFFHAFEMPFYHHDMLTGTPPYAGLMNDNLRQACKQLKDQYPNLIGSIKFRFMRGNTNSLFRNFTDANNIDMIVCPQDYIYTKVHKDSINPVSFFKRSRIPVLQNMNRPEKTLKIKESALNLSMATAS